MSTLQPGGAFEIALYDSDFFTNASNDDLLIRPMLDRQRILIGTNSNANASMMITSNTVFVNNNLYLYSKLGVGKSNLFDDYPVDIVGNAAIDGSVNSTKFVLCRGLQLKKKFGSYYQTTSLPSGLIQGLSNDGLGLVMYINGGSESNYLKFLASNQDLFHIEGSGNVGIGTSNPYYKLEVIGTISTTEGVKIGSNFIWDYSNVLGIDTASNLTRLSINKTSGYVGIATKTPGTSLDISTTDAMRIPTGTTAQRPSVPTSGYMRYNTTTSTFEGYGGTAWGSLGGVKDTNQDTYISAESYPTSNDDIIRFYNSNTETLRINAVGNIGVSNQAPSERLEVSGGNAKFNSNIYVLQRLGVSTSNPTEIVDIIGNLKASSNIYSSSRMGVNTSNPTERLEVQGNAKISNNAYVMNWMGVGTSNPTVDFEVIGSAKINTNLEVVGNMTVRGTSTTVDSQTVTIKDNIIRINNGATYISSLQAGLEINRGAGYSNYYFIYDEPTSLFKIGQPQGLQAVATREDNPNDSTIPFYSFANNRYSSCNYLVFNGGKLGVGLQTPQEALHVDGNVKVTSGTIINAQGHFVTPSPMVFDSFNGSFYFRKLTSDSNISSFTDLALLSSSNLTVYGNSYTNGRLGVGTNAPTQSLHLYGNMPTLLMQNSSPGTGNTQLRFQHSNGTTLTEIGVSWQSNVFIANKQQGSISFETNALQRMSIGSNGYVAIGCNNPVSLLNVDGGGYTTNTYPTSGHLLVNYSNNGGMGGSLVLRNSGGALTLGSKAGIAFELDNSTAFNENGTDSANASIYGIIETAANNAGALTFNTWNGSANGERARINGSGMIINGTSALSSAQLTVNSKLFVGAATSGGNYTDAIIHIAKTSAAPSMTFEYNSIGTGHIRLENSLFRWVADGSHSFEIANGVTNTNPTGTGTSLMRITGTGDVGIGTTTPVTKLQVNGTISGTSISLGNVLDVSRYISAYNSNLGNNTNDKALFVCGKSGTLWNQFECYYYHVADGSSANYLSLGNWARQLFAFTTGGSVGIGTTSPSFKIHNALGSAFIGDITYASTTIPTTATSLGTANGYRLVFDNTFNATVGSGMAANKIVLHNNNFLAGFGIESGAVTYHSGGSHNFYVNTNNTATYGTAAMTLNGSGILGIGTTSPNPQAKLHLSGVGFSNQLHFSSTDQATDSKHWAFGPTGVIFNAYIWNDAYTATANWLQVTRSANTISSVTFPNGNVGIGTTSPSTTLHVSASGAGPSTSGIYCYNPNNTANQDAVICARVGGSSAGNPYLSFDIAGEAGWTMGVDNADANKFKLSSVWNSVSGATRLTMDASGNLGIGTSSPAYKLDVAGTARFNGGTVDVYRQQLRLTCEVFSPSPNLLITKDGVDSWASNSTFNAYRYIKCTNPGTAGGFDFNVGPGGVGIGYEPADWSETCLVCNGTVGIGTRAPSTSYKLHVSGDVYQNRLYLNDGYWLVRQGYDVNNYNWDSYPCIVSYNKSGEFRVHGGGGYSLAIRCDGGYLPFTGCHEAFRILPESCIGLIVIANGRHITETKDGIFLDQITVMDAFPEIDICTKKKDKRVYGVLSEIKYHGTESNASFKKSCKVNSIGEGGIWVANANGSIENGDYITSSDVHGYGEKQDECFICNYTVAKITQDCDFNPKLIKRQRALMTDNHVSYDENGRLLGETCKDDSGNDIYDLEYPLRYVRKDGSIITKEAYDTALAANEEVYKAALVGCTYHCG